jgi:hypothetical protein
MAVTIRCDIMQPDTQVRLTQKLLCEMAVTIKIPAFWDVTLCSLTHRYYDLKDSLFMYLLFTDPLG